MSRAPERGVPLTVETVGLLQPGDWLQCRDGRVTRLELELDGGLSGVYLDGSTHANSPASHFTFLGRPDADGWIAHDGRENPASGLRVEVRTRGERDAGTFCCDPRLSASFVWAYRSDGREQSGDIIAWRPHVATAPSPSTAETVVVPVDDWRHVIGALKNAKARLPMGAAVGNVSDALSKVEHLTPSSAPAREPEGGAVDWLPIETALQDGTKIDLWGYWPEHDRWVRTPDAVWDTERCDWKVNGFYVGAYVHPPRFTHWRAVTGPAALTPRHEAPASEGETS